LREFFHHFSSSQEETKRRFPTVVTSLLCPLLKGEEKTSQAEDLRLRNIDKFDFRW
jgi:hypothetical protein